MSAFVGIVSFSGQAIDVDVFEKMLARVEYRGLDGVGRFVTEQAVLGHRLFKSTFEADYEHQPFVDGNITIVADALLQNRAVLLDTLQQHSESITLQTPDVELIIRAYQVWGPACVNYLEGSFVFAIWDQQQKHLFLARDQFGTRPLFYAIKNGIIVFSNELSAVRLHPIVRSDLNEIAVSDFLMFGTVSRLDKSQTIFADITRLLPAHYMKCAKDHFDVIRYWSVPDDIPMLRYRKESEYVEQFYDIFTTLVQNVLRGPEIALLLSGGMDSGALAAVAHKLIVQQNLNIQLNFITGSFEYTHKDTEGFHASLTARQLNKDTHFFVYDPYTFGPQELSAEPVIFYAGYLFDQLRYIRAFGRLAINGMGGDEVLFGSTIYDVFLRQPVFQFAELYIWLWKHLRRRPPLTGVLPAARRRVNGNLGNPVFYDPPLWLRPRLEQQYNLSERWQRFWHLPLPSEHPIQPVISRLIYHPDWQQTFEPYQPWPFTSADPIMPFLNIKLLEFALALPPVKLLDNKYIMRKALDKELPAEITQRKKEPLGSLMNSLATHPDAGWVFKWHPQSEVLSEYVDLDQLLPLNPQDAVFHVQLRALFLDHWLLGCL